MRRYLLLILTITIPALLWGQKYYSLTEKASSKAKLLSINDVTVLIQPITENNEAQKWLSFDTALNVIAAKKLVTPNAKNIIIQNYLEGENKVIRIDQSIIDDVFYVSAFVFDVEGNIIKKQEINLASAAKRKLSPTPFIVIQSPDKRVISLIQMRRLTMDSILVSAISINENLATTTSSQFQILFDENLEELLTPLNDNDGNIYILKADKFISYTLGSNFNVYTISAHERQPQPFRIAFSRKKLSDYHFQLMDNNLHFSALFSSGTKKLDLAGILYGKYNLHTQQLIVQKEKVFNDSFKTNLKKEFETQGHKGEITNYLITLPHPTLLSKHISYGVLLPIAEKDKRPLPTKERYIVNNLLLLGSEGGHQFAKIRIPVDRYLQFFAYIPSAEQYSALHYYITPLGKTRLKLTTINTDGVITEKKFLENKNKVLINGFHHTITANSLITFYQEKNTGEMGLVMIKL